MSSVPHGAAFNAAALTAVRDALRTVSARSPSAGGMTSPGAPALEQLEGLRFTPAQVRCSLGGAVNTQRALSAGLRVAAARNTAA
ncbi:hypothetical protein OH407_23705, partial [Salmonella enterica]|uniref:hypothetical protein n=1 Tax=Salmonella enterica TaxID=28901 RepID=UPI0022B7427B